MLLLVKLKFKRAIKIGEGDLSQGEESRRILHSDTIFSALINEWVRIFGTDSTADLISNLTAGTPPFKISSAFPFHLDEYYLPVPCGTHALYMEKLKDVSFLELFDFLELSEGNQENIKKKKFMDPTEDLMVRHIAPRVTIDRTTALTNIYQLTGFITPDEGGLYFLIDLKDESLRKKFELCIKMLGESGIGGDRSIGYGLFNEEIINADEIPGWTELFQKKQGDVSYYTLSLCCPVKEEAKEVISYQILSRKGWIFSRSSMKQMKRRECKMFAEGSLFKRPIKGQIADVTPKEFRSEHDVFRYGLGMMIEMIEGSAESKDGIV